MLQKPLLFFSPFPKFLYAVLLFFSFSLSAQVTFPLTDLSAFKQASSSWHIAGGVNADLNTNNILRYASGAGVLVNVPDEKNKGADLYTNIEHSDADLELDYMM